MCLSLALPLQGVHAPCLNFLQEAASSVLAFTQEYCNGRQENKFVVHFISNSKGNQKTFVFGPCFSPSSMGLKFQISPELRSLHFILDAVCLFVFPMSFANSFWVFFPFNSCKLWYPQPSVVMSPEFIPHSWKLHFPGN